MSMQNLSVDVPNSYRSNNLEPIHPRSRERHIAHIHLREWNASAMAEVLRRYGA